MTEVTPDMFAPHLGYALPQYTSVGCYTLLYLAPTAYNGLDVLCAKCATIERTRGYQVNTLYVTSYDEGANETCNECGCSIPSSYGEVGQ